MIIHVKKDTSNLKISSEAGSIVILFEDIAKLRKLGSKILNPVIVVKLTKCMILGGRVWEDVIIKAIKMQ